MSTLSDKITEMLKDSDFEWITGDLTKLPDGTYNGLIGGYVIAFEHNDELYKFKHKKMGLRGMNIRATFTKNGTNYSWNY